MFPGELPGTTHVNSTTTLASAPNRPPRALEDDTRRPEDPRSDVDQQRRTTGEGPKPRPHPPAASAPPRRPAPTPPWPATARSPPRRSGAPRPAASPPPTP